MTNAERQIIFRDPIRRRLNAEWLSIRLKEQEGKCHWCQQPLFRRGHFNAYEFPGPEISGGLATIDHVIPLAQDGPDTLENIVAACSDCNQRRGDGQPVNRRKSSAPLKEESPRRKMCRSARKIEVLGHSTYCDGLCDSVSTQDPGSASDPPTVLP